MDNFLDSNKGKADELQEKKQIVIKHRKIKKATRTFLYNVDHWLSDDDIKSVQTKLKKKLGTSSQIVEDDEGKALTFNGDHTQEIKDLMIEATNKLNVKSFA